MSLTSFFLIAFFLQDVYNNRIEDPEIAVSILSSYIPRLKGDSLGEALLKRGELEIKMGNYGLASRDFYSILLNQDISAPLRAKVVPLLFETEIDTGKIQEKIKEFLITSEPFPDKDKLFITSILYYMNKNQWKTAENLSRYFSLYSKKNRKKGKIFLFESLLNQKPHQTEILVHLGRILKEDNPEVFIKSLFISGDTLKAVFYLTEYEGFSRFLNDEMVLVFDRSLDFKRASRVLLNSQDSVGAGKRFLLLRDFSKAEKLLTQDILIRNRFWTYHKIEQSLKNENLDSIPVYLHFIKNLIPEDSFWVLKRDYFVQIGARDSLLRYKKNFEKYGIPVFMPELPELSRKVFLRAVKHRSNMSELMEGLFNSGDYQGYIELAKDKGNSPLFNKAVYFSLLRGDGLNEKILKNLSVQTKEDSLIMGKIYLRKQDTLKALAFLPYHQDGSLLRGRINFNQGNYEESFVLLKDSPYLVDRIRSFLSLLYIDRTDMISLKNIDIDRVIKYKLGRLFLIKYAIALKDWVRLTNLYEKLYPLYYEDIEEFKEYFAYSLWKNGKTLFAFVLAPPQMRGEFLFSEGLFDEAKKVLKKNFSERARVLLAKIYYEEKKPDSILSLNLPDSLILREKTFSLISKGKSIDSFPDGISKTDTLYKLYFDGLKAIRGNKFQLAESLFTLTLTHPEIKPRAYLQLGSIAYIQGKWKEAVRYFREGVSSAQGKLHLTLLYNLGVALDKMESDSVREIYSEIINKFPETGEYIWAKKKIIYEEMEKGNFETALKGFNEIFGLSKNDEENMEVLFFRGQALSQTYRYKEALSHFLTLYKNYPSALFGVTAGMSAGEIYETQGKFDKAVLIYQEIVRTHKGTPFAEDAEQKIKRLRGK